MSKGDDEQAGSNDTSTAPRHSTISIFLFLSVIFETLMAYERISLEDIPLEESGDETTLQSTAVASNYFTSNGRQRNSNGTTQALASSSTGRTESMTPPPRNVNDSATRSQASTPKEPYVSKQALRQINIIALSHLQEVKNDSTLTQSGKVRFMDRITSTMAKALDPPRS
ncbi:hypothetical protein TWF173_006602 [Orbilia oligospora]|nr:hypothetical protein TWF173_006602 [Orbilia oligospora]